MNLEQQVCSLGLSKRLKELGVKQKSYFFWDDHREFSGEWIISSEPEMDRAASAFTVAELGEMLPHGVETGKTVEREAWCSFPHFTEPYGVGADTEADARAKMLIYLLEGFYFPLKDFLYSLLLI